jgi:hypothetical protein
LQLQATAYRDSGDAEAARKALLAVVER